MNNLNIDENVLRAMSLTQNSNFYTVPTMLVDLPSKIGTSQVYGR